MLRAMKDTRSKKPLVVVAVVAVVALIAGAVLWYVSRDTPAEVDLATAAQGVQERTTTTPATDGAGGGGEGRGDAPPPEGVTGTWTVDSDSGEFDYDSATGSFAGFRIEEELVGIGATEAVGRTGAVSGTMTIDGTRVTAVDVQVDLSTITTNDSRRDRRALGAMNTAEHPVATFTLTSPIELGDDAADGTAVTATGTGDLTVNGTTNPVTASLEAQLVGETVVVVGTVPITFADFGVSVPSAPVVVSAADHGVIELQLLFVRGS